MQQEDELRVEQEEVDSRGGIRIEETPGEIEPPLGRYEEGEGEEPPDAKQVTGKIPLSPAVIKPPLRLEGRLLAETTGWNGWLYTEEELDELCNLIDQCGIEMSPQVQVVIALGTMHGARAVGYFDWRRRGRPGDSRKQSQTGVEKREERPGEEVRA